MRHTRMRWLIVAVALVATLATTLLAGPVLRSTLAASGPPPPYLALGDSVAFGYSPLVDPSDPHNFSGYPAPAARALMESLTNAACPGETSSHFIDLTGSDNGCGAFRAKYPLHVAYSGSQLAFADSFLMSHPTTQLVSINIGANDLFLLEKACGGASTPAEIQCIQNGLPAMLGALATHLNTIYYHIRTLDGYHNQLVALTYYSLDYGDTIGTNVISQVNNVVAQATQAAGGIIADGFGAFEALSTAFSSDTCAAGLRIVEASSPLTCDIHPSYPSDNGLESHADTGRDVLGQAIVNALHTA